MATVVSARVLTGTTINVDVRSGGPDWGATNGVVFDTIMVKESGHVRTLASTGGGGRQYIKGGIMTLNIQPAPGLKKCQN